MRRWSRKRRVEYREVEEGAEVDGGGGGAMVEKGSSSIEEGTSE